MGGTRLRTAPRFRARTPAPAPTPTAALARVGARVAAAAALLAGHLPAQEPPVARLRAVRITTADVFDDETAARYWVSGLVNAVHWTTREEVVAREIWLRPGDVVDAETADEVERNLRALRLFADVSVRLAPTDTPGEVDLVVDTRDRLSLSFSAGASYVGGTTSTRADVGEGNLWGYGDRVSASFARNSDNEFRGSIGYVDLHLFDTWHTAGVRLTQTDEGDGIGLSVRRPFKHLADPRGYGVDVAFDQTEVDYYRNGDSVAQVDDDRARLAADIAWGSGPRDRRRTHGLRLEFVDHDYGDVTGPLGPQLRVPGDTRWLAFGPTATWQWVDGYRKVEGLDTLGYIQDLTLGLDVAAALGARWRHEDGAGSDLQPECSARARWAAEPLTAVYTNLVGAGGLRWDGGEAVGYFAVAEARAFWLLTGLDTLACSVTYDVAEEAQDLPVELTLGEDNGLRGYPARELVGSRRLRVNVENRFDTGLELATFRPGLVAFFDAGDAATGNDLGPLLRSTGVGLRVGSKPLLGSGVVRIDFAKPLDDVPGEDSGWQVSFAIGQVFTFGGSSSELGTR